MEEAERYIRSLTRSAVAKEKGYTFGDEISYACHLNTVILKATNSTGTYCAKVAPATVIEKEATVAGTVRGLCVMPVVDKFEISAGRSVLIAPLYSLGSLQLQIFGG